jgi:hypothetical protein
MVEERAERGVFEVKMSAILESGNFGGFGEHTISLKLRISLHDDINHGS